MEKENGFKDRLQVEPRSQETIKRWKGRETEVEPVSEVHTFRGGYTEEEAENVRKMVEKGEISAFFKIAEEKEKKTIQDVVNGKYTKYDKVLRILADHAGEIKVEQVVEELIEQGAIDWKLDGDSFLKDDFAEKSMTLLYDIFQDLKAQDPNSRAADRFLKRALVAWEEKINNGKINSKDTKDRVE